MVSTHLALAYASHFAHLRPPASDLDDLAGILVGISQKQQQQKRLQQQALQETAKADAAAAYFAAQRKKRRRTSPEELDILETTFKSDPMPNQALRQQLAQQLGMTPRRVQIWFQNKRYHSHTTMESASSSHRRRLPPQG